MGKIYKKGAAVFTALSLTACGTSMQPDFDSSPTNIQTSVTIAKPECPIYPLVANDVHSVMVPKTLKPIYWKLGNHSVQIACIDRRTNTILDPLNTIVTDEFMSEYLNRESRIGALVFSLPANCFDENNFNTQYLAVTDMSDMCQGELTVTPFEEVAHGKK